VGDATFELEWDWPAAKDLQDGHYQFLGNSWVAWYVR